MDYLLLRIIQQYYMKTMLHVLHKSKENILKVIELSTFRQSSSTLMNFKKIVKLLYKSCIGLFEAGNGRETRVHQVNR